MYDLKISNDYVYLKIGDNEFIGSVGNFNKTKEVEFFFTNTDLINTQIRYCDISELEISLLPNNITFAMCAYDNDFDNTLENEQIIPYPFDWVNFYKRDNKFSLYFPCSISDEQWNIKWSPSVFFKQLSSLSETYGFVTNANQDTLFNGLAAELTIDSSDCNTISDALHYATKILNELISEAKLSLEGFAKFQQVLNIWQKDKSNDSEEYWQKLFYNHSWVIAQSLSLPFIIFGQKAYMGGKDITNTNGNIIDFIYRNNISQNITLIEIKTPNSQLVGKEYRGNNIFSLSNELTGAINQLLFYKDTCHKDFHYLNNRAIDKFKFFNPKCLLIIGSLEALNENQKISFELFRNEIKSVEIITFDELFSKIEILSSMQLLE